MEHQWKRDYEPPPSKMDRDESVRSRFSTTIRSISGSNSPPDDVQRPFSLGARSHKAGRAPTATTSCTSCRDRVALAVHRDGLLSPLRVGRTRTRPLPLMLHHVNWMTIRQISAGQDLGCESSLTPPGLAPFKTRCQPPMSAASSVARLSHMRHSGRVSELASRLLVFASASR
jgi:hypothetical protein